MYPNSKYRKSVEFNKAGSMAEVFYQEIGNTTQISGVILVNQPNMESARTEVRLFAGIGTILDTCGQNRAPL